MVYILIFIIGITLGSLINAYIHIHERTMPLHKWYIGLFYKHLKFILVEITLACAFVLIYNDVGSNLQFVRYCLMSTLLLAASAEDLQSRTIPNKIVIVGIITGIIMAAISLDEYIIISAVLGFLVAAIVWGLLHLITKGGVGMGDVKLFACAGIFLGFGQTINTIIISTVLSGIAGILLIIMKKSSRKGVIPFAPFIFAGSILSVLFS